MKINNHVFYQKWVDNNKSDYGKAVIDYAIRWADLMEPLIEAGEKLENIAKYASREADTELITGFQYGCAVGFLWSCWEHGEELRIWHNLETQFGTEGEEANKNDGILNPALITIQTKEK